MVRLKGGDPFLFGRGGEEVEALAEAGLAWEVVPGVTSAFGVPASAGIPVTQRGVAASVTVVTGRVGEPDGTSAHDWEALARVGGTLVILMGMTNRAAIAAALVQGGLAPDTAVAVIARGRPRRSGWRARRWPAWPTWTSVRPPSSSWARWRHSARTTHGGRRRRTRWPDAPWS